MKLSEKMIQAGWVIAKQSDNSFVVYGSHNRMFSYNPTTKMWSVGVEEIEKEVDKDLEIIEQGKRSPITSSSRLTALNHTRQSSQPVRYICSKGLAKGKSVLHWGTGLDRFAKQDLLDSGCLSVADYDPNFYPDSSVLKKKYDIVMAHYVLNILPPKVRHQVYQLMSRTLNPGGIIYLTVQGVWPVMNKYNIIKAFEDGYLIKTGLNQTFRKGYESIDLVNEIQHELGGQATVLSMFYSNTLISWKK
ncbi:MAG: class I SAM-dependent methyltransferase [Lentisphaeria bacterium]